MTRTPRVFPHHLIGVENSLLAHKNSLFRRVGNSVGKARKTQGKFGMKIAPNGPFCGNSLQKSLLTGISEEWAAGGA
jgi:hypothetical protein